MFVCDPHRIKSEKSCTKLHVVVGIRGCLLISLSVPVLFYTWKTEVGISEDLRMGIGGRQEGKITRL